MLRKIKNYNFVGINTFSNDEKLEITITSRIFQKAFFLEHRSQLLTCIILSVTTVTVTNDNWHIKFQNRVKIHGDKKIREAPLPSFFPNLAWLAAPYWAPGFGVKYSCRYCVTTPRSRHVIATLQTKKSHAYFVDGACPNCFLGLCQDHAKALHENQKTN